MLRSVTQDDAIFDALGNSVRRQILRLLSDGPRSVGELAAAFTVSRPAISRHLALLEDAGLVTHRGEGTRNVYGLDQRGFVASAEWLSRFWDEAEARLRLVAENLPEKETRRG
jgi:DNA-binding transcriptional ArsR family regulator